MSHATTLATSEAAALGSAHALVIRRTFPAPPERLFAAWTRPELLRRWFGPGPIGVEEAVPDEFGRCQL